MLHHQRSETVNEVTTLVYFSQRLLTNLAVTEGGSHYPAMLLLFKVTLWGLCSLARSRQALVLENFALRHQLATLAHRARRSRLVAGRRLRQIEFWRGTGSRLMPEVYRPVGGNFNLRAMCGWGSVEFVAVPLYPNSWATMPILN